MERWHLSPWICATPGWSEPGASLLLAQALPVAGWEWAVIASVGLAVGLLGGMLGVGGSIVLIPALALLFGAGDAARPGMGQHLYQASAMVVNVAVLAPAAWNHHRAGQSVAKVLRWMAPVAVICVLLGVAGSNLPVFQGAEGGVWLGRVLAAFLVYVMARNIRKLAVPGEEAPLAGEPAAWRCGAVGAALGGSAGLLGIGGGALAVPLQQTMLAIPLRRAIANSAMVIVLSASVGATFKIATLDEHGVTWWAALAIAGAVAPAAAVGGALGARLSLKLPLRQVRMVWLAILAAAAWKMAHLPWP